MGTRHLFGGVVLLAVALTLPARGQISGSVSGSVVDQTGALVPGARVTLTLPGGKTAVLETRTTGEGLFTLSAVRPATYTISVEAPGFHTATVRDFNVDPAKENAVPPIQLQLATQQAIVEVIANATPIQIASSDVSVTVTHSRIDTLPVVDRQVSTLFITQAGVTNSRTTSSINGLRPSYTNVLLDGINIQDSVRTNDLDYLPGKLTIGEVDQMTISTSNADPTIGGNATSIVLVTPSGSNQYHGEGYWYNRNSFFAANNWFNNKNSVKRPFENLNQLGGTFGGPVFKDKLLFFGAYEAYRDRANTPKNTTILTPTARQGILRYNAGGAVQSFNVLTAQNLAIDPFIQSELNMMPTAGNNTSIGDGLNTTGYSFNARSNETRDNVTGKLDYYLSARHAFSGTYKWNRDIVDRPDQGTFFSYIPPVSNDNHQQFLSTSWRWNPGSTFTNEVRGGFSRQISSFLNGLPDPKFYVSNASVIFTSPVNEFRPQFGNTAVYSIQDNANWVKGRHSMSFGFQSSLWRIQYSIYSGTIPSYGVGLAATSPYGFSTGTIPGASSTDTSTANLLLVSLAGVVSTATQTFYPTSRTSGFVPGAPFTQGISFNNYAPYFSDKWKVARNLTLTLGVRWENFNLDFDDSFFLQPRVDNGNVVDALLGNATLDFAGSSVGRPITKRDKNNFGPNLGFAWDPRGEGNMVLRGGYSIAYAIDNNANSGYNVGGVNNGLISNQSLANLNAIVSKNAPTITAPPFKIPTSSLEQFNLTPSAPPVQGLIDPNLAIPYVEQWNFGIQKEVRGWFVVEGRYVGNHAVKMLRQIDFNQINIFQEGYLQDFIKARSNGFLALSQRGTFNATYNPAVTGSVPLPFFDKLASGGALTNATVSGLIRGGEAGSLAQTYQAATPNFFPHPGFSYFPNPYVLYSSLLTNFGNSTYNAMQLEIRRTNRAGIQLQANYTWSKSLSDALLTRGLDPVLDNNNPRIEKARTPFDVTHSFKANYSAPLPFGSDRKFHFRRNGVLDRITGGWILSGFLHIDSGPPVSILSAIGTLNRGARSGQNTVDTNANLDTLRAATGLFMTGNGPYFVDPSHIGSDGRGVAPDGAAPFAGQLFFKPQPGSLGSLQRRILNGPVFWNYNFGVIKETKLFENHLIQFRADFYNIFNHPNFFAGDQTVTSSNFGKMTSTLTSGENVNWRTIQFGLTYKF